MKISEYNIWQALSANKANGLSARELLVWLKQKKAKKAKLKNTLVHLAKKGIIKKHNNKYFLTEDGKDECVPPKKEQKPLHLRDTRKGELTGVFVHQDGENYIRVNGTANKYYLKRDEAALLMHGDEVSFSVRKASHAHKYANLTKVLKRKHLALRGTVITKKGKALFLPSNKHFSQAFELENQDVMPGGKVILQITQYPERGKMPQGRIVTSFHSDLDQTLEIEKILKEHSIFTTFSDQTVADCKKMQSEADFIAEGKRRDLTKLPFVTIDGVDAKDFDDAIYAEAKKDGGYRLWVSIADVAEYVTFKSNVDIEAFERGTSVYLPGKVYPMLPEELSNDLCSLRPKEVRNCLTCEMELNFEGKPIRTEVYESVIYSAARLTYDEVDTYLETGKFNSEHPAELPELLTLYKEIADVLTKRRKKRGAIEFSFPDTYFDFDKEGALIDIRRTNQTPAQGVIEQFMLEANENVAFFCIKNQLPILFRNHSGPTDDRMALLRKEFMAAGVKISRLENSGDINRALEQIKGNKNAEQLQYSLLRSMSQAFYEQENLGHYGLSAEYYCHFTSPIRRYPDLVVHRALKDYLHGRKPLNLAGYIGEHCSALERAAAKTERSVGKLKKMLFMTPYMGDTFTGTVSGTGWNSFWVELDHPYVEGYVSLASVDDDYYQYQESNSTLIGERTGRQIKVGKKVEITLAGLKLKEHGLDFEWIRWVD